MYGNPNVVLRDHSYMQRPQTDEPSALVSAGTLEVPTPFILPAPAVPSTSTGGTTEGTAQEVDV